MRDRKWPEPWEHERGFIEDVTGTLAIPDVGQFEVQLKLSCRYRKTPSKLSDWTAVAVTNEGDLPLGLGLPEGPLEIRIPERQPAKAHAFNITWLMSGSKAVFTLAAASNYPEKSE